jgi:hypothetical protein
VQSIYHLFDEASELALQGKVLKEFPAKLKKFQQNLQNIMARGAEYVLNNPNPNYDRQSLAQFHKNYQFLTDDITKSKVTDAIFSWANFEKDKHVNDFVLRLNEELENKSNTISDHNLHYSIPEGCPSQQTLNLIDQYATKKFSWLKGLNFFFKKPVSEELKIYLLFLKLVKYVKLLHQSSTCQTYSQITSISKKAKNLFEQINSFSKSKISVVMKHHLALLAYKLHISLSKHLEITKFDPSNPTVQKILLQGLEYEISENKAFNRRHYLLEQSKSLIYDLAKDYAAQMKIIKLFCNQSSKFQDFEDIFKAGSYQNAFYDHTLALEPLFNVGNINAIKEYLSLDKSAKFLIVNLANELKKYLETNFNAEKSNQDN